MRDHSVYTGFKWCLFIISNTIHHTKHTFNNKRVNLQLKRNKKYKLVSLQRMRINDHSL